MTGLDLATALGGGLVCGFLIGVWFCRTLVRLACARAARSIPEAPWFPRGAMPDEAPVWLDIATAPRDGRNLSVRGCPGELPALAYWDARGGRWIQHMGPYRKQDLEWTPTEWRAQ